MSHFLFSALCNNPRFSVLLPTSPDRAIFETFCAAPESVWSGDKLVFHRNQKSARAAAATTSVADGARNLCSESPGEGKGEGRDEGRGRHARPRPHAHPTKNPKFIRQRGEGGREGGREGGEVLLQMTHEIRFRIAAREAEGGHCIMKEQKDNDTAR